MAIEKERAILCFLESHMNDETVLKSPALCDKEGVKAYKFFLKNWGDNEKEKTLKKLVKI